MTQDRAQCAALVSLPWAPSVECLFNASQERLGRPVCGTHARQYDRWVTQSRGQLMAEQWWKWVVGSVSEKETQRLRIGVPRDEYSWNHCMRDLALTTGLTLSEANDVVWSLRDTAIHPYDAAMPLSYLLVRAGEIETASYRMGHYRVAIWRDL